MTNNKKGVYISFVGYFSEGNALSTEELNTFWPPDDAGSYYEEYEHARVYALRGWARELSSQLPILESKTKDSLTVTVYGQIDDDWAWVVADCADWVEIAHVNKRSFESGAAVPVGCEVRILD